MTNTQKHMAASQFSPSKKVSSLQQIIAEKTKCEKDLMCLTEQVEACLAVMIQKKESYNLEYEALEAAETAAAERLDRAKDALVNYQPKTADEYGIHAIALIDSLPNIIGRSGYAQALKRGAEQLSQGALI